MPVSQQELVQAWTQVLNLCKVAPTETVCLLTRPGVHMENVEVVAPDE